ncbi:MAG: hypothetical protein RL492_1765 [Verrucomicrobiota bacterium]|jgi:hypothetical protein
MTSAEQTEAIRQSMQDEKATKDELVRELVEALKEYIIAFGYPCLNEKMDGAKRKAHAALRKAGAL